MLALENPHWGISGVPFMKSTTLFDATAWSIAALVSVDNDLYCEGVRRMRWGFVRAWVVGLVGRVACRKAWNKFSSAMVKLS